MKSIIFSAAAALALTFSSVSATAHGHDNDAVRDFEGRVIKNTWDNCVITKWKSGEYACEGQQTSIDSELLSVYFNFDSDNLTPAAISKLDRVVELLASASNVLSIDIIGYADYLGNVDYNYALSGRRANSVRTYLESLGYLDTRAVDVVGLGEEAPVTACEGLNGPELKACLWRDRRVEIRLNYEM